jgi:hypothetical protein
MGKKCVRGVSFVCLIAALAIAGTLSDETKAQVNDPTKLPLLTADALDYLGGFRLPAETVNGDSFSIGGRAIAFNPAANSLFVSTRSGRVAEVSIPTLGRSADVNALPFAGFLQPFADPTEGHLSEVAGDGVAIDGLMVYGDRLYGTASVYYDANNTQRQSHYSRSLQLNQPSFSGWSQVWETGRAGFVSGLMALIPTDWRTKLGGPALTGQCCIPIAWRTSWGPAAFAFNPTQVGQAAIAASPLLYYNAEHPTLGHWNGSNPTYGATIQIGGLAVIAGTRTAIYVGRNGTGPNCYGNGTSNKSLDGTAGPDGALWCYDPTTSDKGSHAYPYRYQLWAYDLNDFAAVKAGTKQPWEVLPYGVWPFDLPTPEPSVKLGGVGYDSARQILYVSQLGADKDGYSYRPVIHALQIDIPVVAPAPEAPPPTQAIVPVAPAPGPVQAVAIAANKVAPQIPGTTITFTASPTAGVTPYQYKWWIYNGDAWVAMTPWITSNTFAWTPTAANAGGRVAVWVRSAGNNADLQEAAAAMDFVIALPAGTTPSASGRTQSAQIVANKTAPQPAGTTITFNATPTGGAGPHQYKWWIYEDGWKVMSGWTASNSFAWTPASPNPGGRVTVWVRSAGSTVDEQEAAAAMDFVISGTPAPAPTAPTAPTARVSAVTIGANKIAPQPAGSTTTFTALPSGGVTPYQYKWWVYNGDAWVPMTNWTTSNTYAWTSATANAGGRVAVWVRSAANTRDEAEGTAAMDFVISPNGSPAPTGPVTGATIAANRVAPQAPGTTITFTATGVGGAAPYQYKWWTYNGDAWVPMGTWTSSNTFAWTPTAANAGGRVAVWIRSAGATVDEPQAVAAMDFVISTPK